LKLVDSVLGNRRPRTAQYQSLGGDDFATVAFFVHKPVDHLSASTSYFALADFCTEGTDKNNRASLSTSAGSHFENAI